MARHRRALAAGFAGIAVALGLSSVMARPAAHSPVVAAARDLPAGTTLTASDLRMVALPAGAVPAGAITTTAAAIGRTTSGALREGEPLTDVRLDDGPLARPGPGLVAAPVRLADAEAAHLLRPGERVDVLAAATAPGAMPTVGAGASGASGGVGTESASVVAADVQVVSVPTAPAGAGGDAALDAQGALVVLATTPEQARALAQAQVSDRLSAVVVG